MNRVMWLVLLASPCVFLVASYCPGPAWAVAENEAPPLEKVWPLGEVREYLFQMAGQEVGRQWNQLTEGPPADSGQSYRLRFRLSLDLTAMGQAAEMHMDGELSLTGEGRPLSYWLNVSVDGEKQSLETEFSDETVLAKISKGDQESQHRLPISPGIFLVDNNMIGQWGLMLGLLPLKVGDKIEEKIFVPQALSEMNIQVDVREMEMVTAMGAQEEAFVCHVAPMGEIFWVTQTGRLVRLEDQKQSLIVTLVPDEGGISPEESSPDSSLGDPSK